MKLSYNKDLILWNAYLNGKMLDEHTYAGVLRVGMDEMGFNDQEFDRYYDDRNDFLKEKGIDMKKVVEGALSYEDVAQQLGIEEFSDEQIAAIGGPDIADYHLELEIPERFTADLTIHRVRGRKPEEQDTTPEMPQELQDAYTQAMSEQGLSEADYDSFTEEEKEIQHQLYTNMWNQYYELYPETQSADNPHNSWELAGDWNFSLDLEKDHSQTVTKDINLLDEYAVQDRDVSKISIFVCDYLEYMDELKVYYWSEDYEKNKETKTYKQLLQERALLQTEVTFEE